MFAQVVFYWHQPNWPWLFLGIILGFIIQSVFVRWKS